MFTKEDKASLELAKQELAEHGGHMFESLKLAQEMFIKYYEAPTRQAKGYKKGVLQIDEEIFYDPLVLKLGRALMIKEKERLATLLFSEQVVSGGIGICFCWDLAHEVDHIINPSPDI